LAERRIFGSVGKSNHVIFKAQRIAADDWQVVAHCPGAQLLYITGFKTEESARAWIRGPLSKAWGASWDARNDKPLKRPGDPRRSRARTTR
jgi:hypothetical protein